MKKFIFTVLGCLLLIQQPSQAWVSSGHTWAATPVTYYINPTNVFMTNSDAITAIQAGAAVWSMQTQANISLSYGGATTLSGFTNDGVNTVSFRNIASPNGFAGETYFWWDGSGHLLDFDTLFYSTYPLAVPPNGTCASNGVYLDSIAAHEFGHALGLAHSTLDTATMYTYMPSYCDRTYMTLDADDIAGIESLYPPSGSNPTVPTAPATPSPANGATGVNVNVTLSWSSTGATSYDVYFNGNLYKSNIATTSTSVSALLSNTKYTWYVIAKNSSGQASGPVWTFTTKKTSPGHKR